MRGQERIGVAVVGLGVGEQHARAYASNDLCEVRWLCDFDLRKASNLASELRCGSTSSTFEEILLDPDVHLISIASYDDSHYAQVVAALGAGKHVFVEKPLCRTLDELRTVKRTWSNYRGALKLSSNLVLRSAPLYRWLREEIRQGKFGSIYAFDGDYLYGRLQKITHGWRKNINDYSVMLGGGVHLVDLLLWLTGKRPQSVYAVGNRICTSGTDFNCCDYVAATFQCDGDMNARITANFGCVHRHQHVVRIFGKEGTFILDDMGPRLLSDRDPSVHHRPVNLASLPNSKGDLISDFIIAIVKDEERCSMTQHEFDIISICIAVEQSLLIGKPVEVEYV